MDGSKEQPKMTAGLDLGDNYTYLCLIDTDSGEVIEEGRLPTNPEALRCTVFALSGRCESPSRRAPTRLGLAGCSRSVATRYW